MFKFMNSCKNTIPFIKISGCTMTILTTVINNNTSKNTPYCNLETVLLAISINLSFSSNSNFNCSV